MCPRGKCGYAFLFCGEDPGCMLTAGQRTGGERMKNDKLDAIDKVILDILQENAKTPLRR